MNPETKTLPTLGRYYKAFMLILFPFLNLGNLPT